MSRWFRFYDEALDDPKVQKLPPHLFKAWVNLLCLASKNDGLMPPVDDIAFRLRCSAHDAQGQIDELIGLGLIDIRNDMKQEPHNWRKRQFANDTSTARVRKWRKEKGKKACNGDETLHETAPEQNRTDSETETDNPLSPPEGGGAAGFNFRRSRKRDNIAAFEAAIKKFEVAP